MEVSREASVFVVPPGGYRATTYEVEPDASTAGYFFAAAAVTGGEVTVPGLGGDATTVRGTGGLRGVTVNMRDISDTMPTPAALAPFASGPVRIEDVANTRVKECDWLEAGAENLRRLGAEVATGVDRIGIRPGAPLVSGAGSSRTATTAS